MLKRQKTIHLINNCGAIYDEAELIAAMLWYSKKPLLQIKKVSLNGRYPCVSIGREKVHMGRSGKVTEETLDPDILHRAYVNTIKLLASHVEVERELSEGSDDQ